MASTSRNPRKARSAITKLTRQLLERLLQAGADGATPTVLEIHATQLEQMVYRRLAERLPPLAPGASYRYRINDNGITFLNRHE